MGDLILEWIDYIPHGDQCLKQQNSCSDHLLRYSLIVFSPLSTISIKNVSKCKMPKKGTLALAASSTKSCKTVT